MKSTLTLLALAAVLFSCGNKTEETKQANSTTPAVDTTLQFFGEKINDEGAIPATELFEKMNGLDSLQVKITGKIGEVCQKKGCWINMNIGGDHEMRVKFKDYAFFVPKDAAGKTITLEGYAYTDTISVEELKHYAEDAGDPAEEIAKITEPEVEISFEANGVIIKND